MLKKFAFHFKRWHDRVMPDETPRAILYHLDDEVQELVAEFEPEAAFREAVDVQLVLLAWVLRSGYTVEQLMAAMYEKLEVNQSRTWVRNERGDYHHA